MLTGSTVSFTRPNQAAVGEIDRVELEEIGDGGLDDLSKGGFHAQFVDPAVLADLAPGQLIGFQFRLPNGSVEGTATVEWLRAADREVGFRFTAITNDGGRETLLAYLSSAFLGVEPSR